MTLLNIGECGKTKLGNESTGKKPDSEQKPDVHFFKNRYTKARGNPVLLEITCRKCHAWVMDYQKDGPGPLLRCYTDRIHKPAVLRKESFSVRNLGRTSALCCLQCDTELGKPFIYRRKEDKARNKLTENRPAYLVLSDTLPESDTEIPRIEYREKSL